MYFILIFNDYKFEPTAVIDHTLLKQEAREAEVAKLCQEAFEHSFAAVCVNGCWAQFALQTLRALHAQSPDKQPVKVACVVGFPLGASTSETKAFETKQLVEVRLRPHRFVTAGADVCIVCRVRRCVW